jgi:hypothetical protein
MLAPIFPYDKLLKVFRLQAERHFMKYILFSEVEEALKKSDLGFENLISRYTVNYSLFLLYVFYGFVSLRSTT